jgi:hypothetical protein
MQLALGRRIVDGESGMCDTLSPEESEEFDSIERILPQEALGVFRELSIKEALIRNHLSKRSADKKKALAISNSNSWLWLGVGLTYGTSTGDFSNQTADEEEDFTLDSVQKFFSQQPPDSSPISSSSFTMDLTLQSSSSVSLTIGSAPLSLLNMSLNLDGLVRPNHISVIFKMTELLMIDQYTRDPLIPHLISVKSGGGVQFDSNQLSPSKNEDLNNAAQKNDCPFVIRFESIKEKTRVVLTALPLEVCLNRLCIQQILAMFQVPSLGRPVVLTRTPLPFNTPDHPDTAVQTPNHDYLSSSSLEFIFEAEAPKIIIPEHTSIEKGYLLLDTGHLSVKGGMGSAGASSGGMWWEISLTSVNAGLPLISSEMYIFSERSLYLIRPFNLHTTVQTYDQSRADMTVSVVIEPSICGEIDAIKLSRVMHLIQVISTTFRPNSSIETHLATTSPSGRSPQNNMEHHLEIAAVVNPMKCSVWIEAKIPEVSLVMQYNSLDNHFGTLSIPQLACNVQLRPYDLQVLVDLNGLTIEDSLRFNDQRFIVSSPEIEANKSQVHISYTSMNHKESPFYHSYGTEVSVSFTHLHLHCDPHSILFLRPFYEVILGKRLQQYPPEFQPLLNSSALEIRPPFPHLPPPPTLLSPPGPSHVRPSTSPSGMHVVVTFDVISCELLRFDIHGDGATNILEGSLHHKLLTMFLVDIYRLRVEATLDDLISADIQIHSTNILDTREMSKDYHFKTIVKPSNSDNCLNLPKSSFPSTSPPHSSMGMDAETFSLFSPPPPLNQLSISYKQETKANSFVEIVMRDVTGYLSLDTILDLVDVSLKNTFAALDLVKPLENKISGKGMVNLTATAQMNESDKKQISKSTINVHVSIPNPQLILLEDPMTASTRGIIGRCGIDVKYNRETIFGKNIEVVDALHLSVMDNEIFVLSDMQKWYPHQILFPMTLELHMNRTIESDMVISTSFAFDMDTIAADVSLNDILLAQSIMLRRALIQQPSNSSVSTSHSHQTSQIESGGLHKQNILTAYMVSINIGSISLTMVNDFQGKHLPLVKIKLDGTTFTCDGVIEDLRGEGSLILTMESYNNKVSSWEPLIDPWHPRLVFFNSSVLQSFEVLSSHTLQFSISSTFLETIRQTQSILFSSQEIVEIRAAIPTVTFQNHLGVPVDLINSSTQSIIFSLEPGGVASIFIVHQTTGYLYPQEQSGISCEFMTSLPEAVDVVLRGDIGQSRLPVTRLSLNVAKPKRYTFPTKEIRLLDDDLLTPSSSPSFSQSTDPIVEEVFECERYNPLTGEWDTPFLGGDPSRWTDSSGTCERNRESVKLPPNGQWEWSSPWTLEKVSDTDASGSPDPNGWKYSRNFNSFAASSHNGCQFTDSVRRRRWYRIRTPRLTSTSDPCRPLSFLWDAQLHEDGSKLIHLRTYLQIRNHLSYPVSVLLLSKAWEGSGGEVIGPISPNGLFSIPLSSAHASSLQLRPHDQLSKWSQEVRCTLSINNHTQLQDILCFDTTSNVPVPIRTVSQQEEKSLLISLHPPMQITNSLPCRLKLRFFNSLDLRNISGTIICVEEIVVPAGATVNLRNISLTCEVVVSANIGKYGWSQPRVINRAQPKDSFNVSYAHANGTIAFQFHLLFLRSLHQSCDIHLFSEWALVDRTGLDISLLANGNAKGTRKIQRHTYDPTIQGFDKSTKTRLTICPEISNASSHSSVLSDESQLSLAEVYDVAVKTSFQRSYSVGTIDIDRVVYSDRDYVFTYLPYLFRGQTYIQTACEDTSVFMNDSSLLEFKVRQPSIVILLIDKRLKLPPPWVQVSGFKRIYDQCIASSRSSSNSPDTYYSIYGKMYQSSDVVSLGYQYSSKSEVNMYCVLILSSDKTELNSTLLSLLSSSSTDDKMGIGETELCWVHGKKGMTLFSTYDGNVSIGLKQGTIWSPHGINLKVLGTAKGPFEIIDPKAKKAYQLAYNIVPMPGIFSRTKVLTIMPRYCIVNCSDEALEIKQKGSQETMFIEPFSCESWHKLDCHHGTAVHVKCLSSKWSFGTVDLNEVGSAELLLPSGEEIDVMNHLFPLPVVLNVNVHIADPEDNTAVVIVMWKSKPNGHSSLSVRNDSDAPLTLRQASVRIQENGADRTHLFEVHVPPHTWVPFGWADPEERKLVQLTTSESFDNNPRIAKIDLQTFTQKIRIPYGTARRGVMKEVVLSIESLGSGRVIQIVEATEYQSDESLESAVVGVNSLLIEDEHVRKEFKFQCSLSSIGISIIADHQHPQRGRKEFLSMYIENLSSRYMLGDSRGSWSSCEVHIEDIQVDNYSETAVYPVLFRKVKNSRRKTPTNTSIGGFVFESRADNSLISFAFSKEVSPSSSTSPSQMVKYHYLTLRILEFAVEVDSGTIYQFLEIFLNEIKVISRDDILVSSDPSDWILSYSRNLLSIENRFQYVDIYKSQLKAQESKLYFEHLIFHPIKISLTFLQTEYTPLSSSKVKTISSSLLELLTSAVAVELMEIKLNSFIVTDAHESLATLQSRVFTKMWQDVRGQLGTIAGSLSILGSPAGLARNVGNGVQDFFYEPYLGLVQSPEDFLIGIKNGTSSLMVGVVAGTLNSTATLIGSASSGISYLSGDSDFIRQRLLSRQKIHASRHGALDSLKDGSEQVILGITSGVSGIFLKPFEEAQKDGAIGFFRGVGFGVVGAAVKPVLGIADGISSIAHGISNELGDSAATHQVRPPRTFTRSPHDPSVLILSTLNLSSAEAQHFIKLQAYDRKVSDQYIADLKVKRNSQIILSERFLYWRVKDTPLVSYSWSELSHCVFLGEKVGLYLYRSDLIPVLISCRNEDRAVRLYSIFVQHSNLFGNPSMIVPLDIAIAKMPPPMMGDGRLHRTSSPLETDDSKYLECLGDAKRLPENISTVGLLDGYKFGSAAIAAAATSPIPFENLNEMDLLAKAKALIQQSEKSQPHSPPKGHGFGHGQGQYQTLKRLDEIIHWLIYQWDIYHAATRISRCCVTIILNRSDNAIQILRSDLKTGRQVLIFGPQSYEEDSRSILPGGGFVVVFGCGVTPSFLDSGRVQLHLLTGGFDALISSTLQETSCKQLNGYSVGFLEKSSTEWWSKYVILVT